MGDLVLEKNFNEIFDIDSVFTENKKCFLWIKAKSKEGHTIKKKGKTNEKFKFKNIKTIEEAKYGYDEISCLDVKEQIQTIIQKQSISTNFIKINNSFFTFCNALMKVICPRCYNAYAKTNLNPHNHGYMNMRILQSKIKTKGEIFHGIIKCYIAYTINEDKCVIVKKKERLIECFTDLIVNNNYSSLPHYHITNLIFNKFMGLKFNVDEFNKLEKRMKPFTLDKINCIFKYHYRVLKYLCENSHQVFIRHGLEKKTNDYQSNMIYPPNDDKHGWRIHNVTNVKGESQPTLYPAYPIEVDNLPFKRCSAHSSKEIYGNVKGFIAKDLFKKLGGSIHIRYERKDDLMPRDHLFAESKIPISSWIFTYRKNNDPTIKETIKKAINALVENEIPIIDEAIIPNFLHVYEAICNKFILLH